MTHFCCAPAHLIALLHVPAFDKYDLSSLEMSMTGGASCPIEVIREVQARLPGKLLRDVRNARGRLAVPDDV